MSRSEEPRGAGGRRRYVPDWPRNLQSTRRRMGRTMLVMGVLIFFLSFAFVQIRRGADEPSAPLERQGDGWYLASLDDSVPVTVERVIDGDTLDVLAFDQSSLRVRLFGVNAPERGERCGEEATARLTVLAANTVRLLADERREDADGRQLRYLFTPQGMSIDAALITEGLAAAWTSDGLLRNQLVDLEEEAREARRGCLWADG